MVGYYSDYVQYFPSVTTVPVSVFIFVCKGTGQNITEFRRKIRIFVVGLLGQAGYSFHSFTTLLVKPLSYILQFGNFFHYNTLEEVDRVLYELRRRMSFEN